MLSGTLTTSSRRRLWRGDCAFEHWEGVFLPSANGRFPYTGRSGQPAKIIAGANGRHTSSPNPTMPKVNAGVPAPGTSCQDEWLGRRQFARLSTAIRCWPMAASVRGDRQGCVRRADRARTGRFGRLPFRITVDSQIMCRDRCHHRVPDDRPDRCGSRFTSGSRPAPLRLCGPGPGTPVPAQCGGPAGRRSCPHPAPVRRSFFCTAPGTEAGAGPRCSPG